MVTGFGSAGESDRHVSVHNRLCFASHVRYDQANKSDYTNNLRKGTILSVMRINHCDEVEAIVEGYARL